MIIHKPVITTGPEEITLSARIEFEKPRKGYPEELWFRFPKDHMEFITDYSDGFVVSLVLLGMKLEEDIEVKGTVSPNIIKQLEEYQEILHSRSPQGLKIVNIKYEDSRPIENIAGKSGCAFSGGVDSFYTLWKHLPQNEHDHEKQISHALFIHGFDIPIEDKKTYDVCKEAYTKVMKELGITLLTLKTNARQFLKGLSWYAAYCPATTGCCFVFGKLFSKFYIAASLTDEQLKQRKKILIEHWMSTDTLQTIEDGGEKTRYEKTAIISKWPVTYPCLRVCWENPNGLDNCCRCEKCVRTMLTLELEGALKNYTTFKLPLTPIAIMFGRFWGKGYLMLLDEIREHAVQKGRKDIIRYTNYSKIFSFVPNLLTEILRHVRFGTPVLTFVYKLLHLK